MIYICKIQHIGSVCYHLKKTDAGKMAQSIYTLDMPVAMDGRKIYTLGLQIILGCSVWNCDSYMSLIHATVYVHMNTINIRC